MTEKYSKDNRKVKSYAGLPSYTVLLAVFNLIALHVTDHKHLVITKFEQCIMVLMKLPLNLRK